jgi:phenylacetate-CoA ligase
MLESLYKFYWYFSLKVVKKEKIQELKIRRLREIVKYAYEYVSFYRKLWKKLNLSPSDIKDEEDLKKLPIIDKKMIKRNYNSFISQEYKGFIKHLNFQFLFFRQTSGSTGKPLKVYFDIPTKAYLDAIYANAIVYAGYNTFKPLLYYWWSMRENKWYSKIFGYFKKIFVPIHWDELKQLEFMQKIKPEYIYYYPSQLFFIAKYILHNNIRLNFKPKIIITHAEILTETMRKTIEEAFDAPVHDEYGSNEFNRIAFECKHKLGYHVPEDALIVEILDENGNEVKENETGEVVITSLLNKAMPLIRYRQEDYAIKTDNKCEIAYPIRIKSIEGRKQHSISKKITQKKLMELLVRICKDFWKCQLFFDSQLKAKLVVVPWKESGYPDTKPLKRYFKEINVVFSKDLMKNRKTGKCILVEKTSKV